jgi:serine/threonine protein kinase
MLTRGSMIAGCRIEAPVGRGGMGMVYRARQLALDRPVAVKLIAAELASNPAFRARFAREARTAASVDHPTP